MTAKLNEKLEFLRSGSEQDLLKEFKKNKALLKKLKTIKKIFDEVFEEAKERIELGEAKEDDEAIVMFHENPELIFDFSETIDKMEITVDSQQDALVLSTIDQFHFKSESNKTNIANEFEMDFPGYKINSIELNFPEGTDPRIAKFITEISNNLSEIEDEFMMEGQLFFYSPLAKDDDTRVRESIRSIIHNQGNIIDLIFYHQTIKLVKVVISVDQNGNLYATKNSNRITILNFDLFIGQRLPRLIVNPIDSKINNDFFDYTFGKISENDFLLKLIKIFKKEAKKVLT